jgi:arylsulfatase A-like enzyme
MRDAFFRWDGFSYYASFSEFLPGVALASILWSIVGVIVTLLLWLIMSVYDRCCKRTGIKFNSEHLLFFTGILLVSGIIVWKGKKLIWPNVTTTIEIKIIVLIIVILVSVFFTILFRNKAERWLNVFQASIAPLVWMFGIFVFLSIPLVAYHSLIKTTDKIEPAESSQTSITDNGSPNIILVTFDALTARNMSLYGYGRDTTPFIDKWSQKATVFTRSEAESNFTTSATASIMTGKRVWSHQTFQIEGSPVKSGIESLPFVLKRNGYYNMAFIANPHTSVEVLGMADSFDVAPLFTEFSEPTSLLALHFGYLEVFLSRLFGNKIRLHKWVLKNDFILGNILSIISNDFFSTTVPPEKIFNRFLQEVNTNSKSPFFAWVHVLPPHDPYLPPDSFKGYFNPSNGLRSFKAQQKIKDESYKYLFDYLRFPEKMYPDIDLMKDYYDEFIRYCDKQFEEFINKLKERNMMDNTVIILSSDHGESFEHGYFTHGGPFLYEQVTHIPLIIKEPDQKDGRIIDSLVEQVDIPSTVLDLADIPVPVWMEGRSLVPFMQGDELSPRPAFSMNFEENPSRRHEITNGSVAVWKGNYKLIRYLTKDEPLLFNLKEDPEELKNLAGSEPQIAQSLLDLIEENLGDANQKIINSN